MGTSLHQMKTERMTEAIITKAEQLGLAPEYLYCALDLLSQNKDMVNALDNTTEMDEYIYLAITKAATDQRRLQAEQAFGSEDDAARESAQRDLAQLSREELITDPAHRAVLPIVAKIVANGPILRLHAEEAAKIVFELADFKRRHRTTSLTQVIVTRCAAELEDFSGYNTSFAPAVAS